MRTAALKSPADASEIPVHILQAAVAIIRRRDAKIGLLTLAGLPAATAPAGLSQDGLPIGIQIVAPRFEEPLILRVARVIHQAGKVGRPPLAA
jgi:Asp-tRNA(Asn)/Glu-tRNA(Gln) amidotransferase A subunit family amidase